MSFKPSDTLDKLSAPTYYFPIMAGERLQRQIDRLLDESLAISSELGMRPLGAGAVPAGDIEGLAAR